jgi:hypothetical protein
MNSVLMPAANGFYRAPAAGAGAGWIEIDLRRVRGKRGLLAALARALRFPEGFGGNWDALADSLQDLAWIDGGVRLQLRGYDRFRAAAAADAAMLEDILAEAAQFWRLRSRLFVVAAEGAAAPPLPGPR